MISVRPLPSAPLPLPNFTLKVTLPLLIPLRVYAHFLGPERRHALRVTPIGERPLSVADYEEKFGKKATDVETVRFEKLGIKKPKPETGVNKKERGFKD